MIKRIVISLIKGKENWNCGKGFSDSKLAGGNNKIAIRRGIDWGKLGKE